VHHFFFFWFSRWSLFKLWSSGLLPEPSLFNPGNGGSIFLQNVSICLQNYTVPQPRTRLILYNVTTHWCWSLQAFAWLTWLIKLLTTLFKFLYSCIKCKIINNFNLILQRMCDVVFYFLGNVIQCVCVYISEFWQHQEFSSSEKRCIMPFLVRHIAHM
jgi:hypothetical protein